MKVKSGFMCNTGVNLINPEIEPTDAELEGLMSAVLIDIKESSEKASVIIADEIAAKLKEVNQAGLHVSPK